MSCIVTVASPVPNGPYGPVAAGFSWAVPAGNCFDGATTRLPAGPLCADAAPVRLRPHMTNLVRIVPLLFLGALACQPKPATTTPPPDGGTTTPPADTAKPAKFSEMTHEQKEDHMKEVVNPELAAVFKGFDGEKYKGFGCATCHVNHVHHPKDGLPKLALSNGGFEKLTAEKPEVMKFMGEQVVPAMAKAMGEQPYDPATQTGYGCAGCHTVE